MHEMQHDDNNKRRKTTNSKLKISNQKSNRRIYKIIILTWTLASGLVGFKMHRQHSAHARVFLESIGNPINLYFLKF